LLTFIILECNIILIKMNRSLIIHNGGICNEIERLKMYTGHIKRMQRIRPVTRIRNSYSPTQQQFHEQRRKISRSIFAIH